MNVCVPCRQIPRQLPAPGTTLSAATTANSAVVNDLHLALLLEQEVSTTVQPGVGRRKSTTLADECRKQHHPEHAIMGWYQSLLPKVTSCCAPSLTSRLDIFS